MKRIGAELRHRLAQWGLDTGVSTDPVTETIAKSADRRQADGVDMCGNIDASFDRPVRYLVENNVGGGKSGLGRFRFSPNIRGRGHLFRAAMRSNARHDGS